MSFFENTRDPKGFGGRLMVTMMNLAHTPVALWGLHILHLAPDAKVLDCGCGGGANIKRLLKRCPRGIGSMQSQRLKPSISGRTLQNASGRFGGF